MKTLISWGAAAALMAAASTAHAALESRANGTMIYDTTRNITWLADMNYARTSGYAGPGVLDSGYMTWNAANAWASGLDFGGYSDWRLPTLNPSDATCSSSDANPGGGFPPQHYGYNCSGGELSGLFTTDLGAKAHESVLNTTGDTAEQIANLALFSNIQSWGDYWSGTEYAPDSSSVWSFGADDTGQFTDYKFLGGFAVAVRSGDVAANVSEPQALALVLLALGASVAVHRRRDGSNPAARVRRAVRQG